MNAVTDNGIQHLISGWICWPNIGPPWYQCKLSLWTWWSKAMIKTQIFLMGVVGKWPNPAIFRQIHIYSTGALCSLGVLFTLEFPNRRLYHWAIHLYATSVLTVLFSTTASTFLVRILSRFWHYCWLLVSLAATAKLYFMMGVHWAFIMTIIAFSGIVHINIHLLAGHCSAKGGNCSKKR